MRVEDLFDAIEEVISDIDPDVSYKALKKATSVVVRTKDGTRYAIDQVVVDSDPENIILDVVPDYC